MNEKKSSQATPGAPVIAPAAAPADLAGLATAAENLDAQSAPAPAAAAAPEKPPTPTSDIVEMAITPLFVVLAPNWKVKESEIKLLSEAYGALLDKYFPDFQTQFGPELACVMVTSAVLLPRVLSKTPRLLEEKPAPEHASE